jgi:dienelactone hydrolase
MMFNSFFKFWFLLILLTLPGIFFTVGTVQSAERISYDVPKGVDLTDIVNGSVANAKTEKIYGHLYMPKNIQQKIPAVIIMHASGGVFDWRETAMAKQLNKSGIAAFIPYSFEARGFRKTKSTKETGTTFGTRLADAFGAFNILKSLDQIDEDRIGIMGYSSGGFASLLSIDHKVKKQMVKDDIKFAAHVNIYASPMLIFRNLEPTDSPMLFISGEKDNLCPKGKILDYADRLRQAGATVEVIIYPGAHHVFDANMPIKTFSGLNDGDCQFEILDNGNLLDGATGENFPERDIYAGNDKHIKPCASKKMTFGGNSKARKAYKKDVVAFFIQTLKP